MGQISDCDGTLPREIYFHARFAIKKLICHVVLARFMLVLRRWELTDDFN